MSVFSFPRLHFKGLLSVNVGTANNDDYSSFSYNNQPMRLADSIHVQPIDFGMDDQTLIAWIQKTQTVSQPATPNARTSFMHKGMAKTPQQSIIPGEWNYYGDMGLTMSGVTVLGVQTGPNQFQSGHPFLGATLSFSTAMLIDVNPEGVPCSQVFADNLLLTGKDGSAIFSGKPSKAVTRSVNFQRNTRLGGPNGAGAYFHCVVPVEALKGQPIVQFMQPAGAPAIAGIVCRYYMCRSLQPINNYNYPGAEWLTQMEALYQKQGTNPTYVQLNGTVAPWFAGEMKSVATGRIMSPVGKPIPVPPPPPGQATGNGSAFRLAPAVAQVDSSSQTISVDFVGTFPDEYQKNNTDPYNPMETDNNPKWDFDAVTLALRAGGKDTAIGAVQYSDTAAGDLRGWVFDFPLGNITPQQIEEGTLMLTSAKYHDLLGEGEYLIASDQSNIYEEQGGSGTAFRSEDPAGGPATIRVFRKGVELTAQNCPPITVWQYAQVPNQDATNFKAQKIMSGYKPGAALQVNTKQPGVFLFAFTFNDQAPAPDAGQLDLMNIPMINLRMLPNGKDYSQYYQNPGSPEPVGNDKLTFQVIYQEVLRNYYILYPAMSQVVPLNNASKWEQSAMAAAMLQRTQPTVWNQMMYMPRTRDLSQSRRTLLQAWARKYAKS